MMGRVEYFKCKNCNKRFETEDDEPHCPICNTENVMSMRFGRKFDVV